MIELNSLVFALVSFSLALGRLPVHQISISHSLYNFERFNFKGEVLNRIRMIAQERSGRKASQPLSNKEKNRFHASEMQKHARVVIREPIPDVPNGRPGFGIIARGRMDPLSSGHVFRQGSDTALTSKPSVCLSVLLRLSLPLSLSRSVGCRRSG